MILRYSKIFFVALNLRKRTALSNRRRKKITSLQHRSSLSYFMPSIFSPLPLLRLHPHPHPPSDDILAGFRLSV